MISTEVVTSPRRVGRSTEEVAIWGGPLQLVKETEEEGEPESRTETRSSFPRYNHIYLFVPTGFGGREKLQ